MENKPKPLLEIGDEVFIKRECKWAQDPHFQGIGSDGTLLKGTVVSFTKYDGYAYEVKWEGAGQMLYNDEDLDPVVKKERIINNYTIY